MKMPAPIVYKFTKLIVSIAAITMLGVVISTITADHTLLYLSGGVAIVGSVRIMDFYRTVKGQNYECIEGTLIWEQAGLARKRHTIVIAQDDGTQVQRILEGKFRLQVGKSYRFYIKKEPVAESQLELPEILQPSEIVLGYEEIPFLLGKQI